MKTIPLLLALVLVSTSAAAAEPTLADIQTELALVKAKLELADAKLELAKKTTALVATVEPPAQRTATEKEREKLDVTRRDQLAKISINAAEIKAIKEATDATSKKNVAALETLENQNSDLKIKLAVTDTAITARDRTLVGTKTGATVAQKDDAQAGELTKTTVASLAKAVDDEVEAELRRTFLRKYGFAINLGYGYVADLARYAPDVQVRYNFFQRQQIDEVRKDRQRIVEGKTRRTAMEKWSEQGVGGALLTDVSGWIGYPLQKFDNKARTVGTKIYAAGTEKEAPLAIGLGIGLGNGKEFSSAVSLNAGVALFNSGAFKRSDLYVGVSVDAVIFKALINSLAEVTGK